MDSAESIRGEDWWPFVEETATDLLAFLDDSEGLAMPGVLADPGPAANDNWLPRIGHSCDERPPAMIWNPRFRTAD